MPLTVGIRRRNERAATKQRGKMPRLPDGDRIGAYEQQSMSQNRKLWWILELMRPSKPVRLETAPTGDKSVYLFLEFIIITDSE